jgi:hypothetical protein
LAYPMAILPLLLSYTLSKNTIKDSSLQHSRVSNELDPVATSLMMSLSNG